MPPIRPPCVNAPLLIYSWPFGTVVLVEMRFGPPVPNIYLLAMITFTFGLLFAIVMVGFDPNKRWYEDPIVIASAAWTFAILSGPIVFYKRPDGGSRRNETREAFRAETRDEIAGLKKDLADIHDVLRAHDGLRETRPAANP